MIKKIVLFVACCLLMLSCSVKNSDTSSCQVEISDFEDTPCDFASMASKVDTFFLYQAATDMPVSAISHACLTDSVLYVADVANALFAFDIHSGKNIGVVHNMGQSSHEYTEITAIAGAGDTICVLDKNTRKVVKYDSKFNYLSTVKLSFMPMDFAVTEDGFLFSRLDAADGNSRFVCTDRNGKETGSCVASTPLGEQIATTRSFTANNADIYLHEPNSNDIYSWSKGQATLAYKLSFPSYDGKTSGTVPVVRDFFVTSQSLICSFLFGEKMCYSICTKDGKNVKAGYFDLNSGRPFSPIAQKADALIGVYHSADLTALKNWKAKENNSTLTVLIYHF